MTSPLNVVLLEYRVLIKLRAKPKWNAAVTFFFASVGSVSRILFFLLETVIFALVFLVTALGIRFTAGFTLYPITLCNTLPDHPL